MEYSNKLLKNDKENDIKNNINEYMNSFFLNENIRLYFCQKKLKK